MSRQWIKEGTLLEDGSRTGALYCQGNRWQIYETPEGGYALAALESLYRDWVRRSMLEDGFFLECAFAAEGLLEAGETRCFAYHVPAGEIICHPQLGPFLQGSRAALDLGRALKTALGRKISVTDGLYCSPLALFLPVWEEPREEAKDVDLVLGRWICGGMNVRLTDTGRMQTYASWLSDQDRISLLNLFDLTPLPPGEGETQLTMPAPYRQEQTNSSQGALATPQRRMERGERMEGPFCLPGRRKLEQFFREEILDVIDREEEYRRFGVGFPGATLLYGPPGSGKTFAVEQLARYLGWPVLQVTAGSVGSKYVHETSQKISELFDAAIREAPSILIIDEMEAFLSNREGLGSTAIRMEETAEFLRRIPDAAKNRVLLFGMTNLYSVIDPAILRKGRFDHILEVEMPSKEEILQVLQHALGALPTLGTLRLERIAGMLEGHPLSDVVFVVTEAGRISVRGHRAGIDMDALQEALRQVEPAGQKRRRIGF